MKKPMNDALVDYVQKCIIATKEDSTISVETMHCLIKDFEDIISDYKNLEKTIKEAITENK
jgi:hypothetical protein